MGRPARTEQETVEELLLKAIPVGECLNCHLRGSVDRGDRIRQYIQVGGRDGSKERVTRVVWRALNGPIPDGLWVLHKCDNSECINIDHLFLGTPQDNTNDMISKGRKIDDLTVGPRRRQHTATRIKELTEQGLSNDDICARLYISKSTLWNYQSGPYRDTLPVSSGDEGDVCVG